MRKRGRFADLPDNKLRGGYYTPPDLAAWLCAWAIRTRDDRVLEPSCGDGTFLEAAAHRFIDLRARAASLATQITGIEIDADEAGRARRRLKAALGISSPSVVKTSDFF